MDLSVNSAGVICERFFLEPFLLSGKEMRNEIRRESEITFSTTPFPHAIIWLLPISDLLRRLRLAVIRPRDRARHESLSGKERRRRPPRRRRLPVAFRVVALRGAGQEGHCQRETHGEPVDVKTYSPS